MERRIEPFPWSALPRVTRGASASARRLRERLRHAVDASSLPRAFGELLAGEVALVVRRAGPAPWPTGHRGAALETADGSTMVVVDPEPQLLTTALGRILTRPSALTDPGTTPDASMLGALAALLLEACRRTGATEPLRAAPPRGPSPAPGAPSLRVDLTVMLDARPYSATAWVGAARPSAPDSFGARDVEGLGLLPVRLRVVAAVSTGDRAALAALRPGDVWMPGAGWLDAAAVRDTPGLGGAAPLRRAALASPTSERGALVGRSADGRLVLLDGDVALPLEAAAHEEPSMSDGRTTLTDAVLDAPVVVRVEVASVTLPAREWAALRPGDVLETGLSLAEPVVLRVAGREVARGELVTVDGELGVRIREILGG